MKFTPDVFVPAHAKALSERRLFTLDEAARVSQAAFDAWIASQPVVYSLSGNHAHASWWPEPSTADNATHRARLVYIEPIEKPKCEHVGESRLDSREVVVTGYDCIKCGVALVATSWQEAK